MYDSGGIVREEHVNPNVANLPVVVLPSGIYNQESSYGSIISNALSEGSITENWMVTAYARTTVPPLAALNFVGYQFLRFGLKVPPKNFLIDVFKYGVYHIDYNHPEMFFNGLTNVALSNDKFYYTYRFGRGSYKGDPTKIYTVESLENFDVYAPFHASKHNFDWLMAHPGLSGSRSENKPFELEHAWDMLQEASDEHDFDMHFGEHWREIFGKQYRDIVHLALWATIMWMIKPDEESAVWRRDAMPIFGFVEKAGECVYLGGDYWLPHEYQKLARPVGSCIVCGMKLPCAEIYRDDNPEVNHETEYFCRVHRPPGSESWRHYAFTDEDFDCSACSFTECPYNNAAKLVVQAPRGRGQILRNNLNKVQAGTLAINSDVIDVSR
jgi:hypothetical protein